MPAYPEIFTTRLHLRAFAEADAPDVQRLAGDRRVAETTMLIPHPYPDGAAEAWIATHEAAWELGRGLVFAVTLRASGDLIGAIGFTIKTEPRESEIGYWIGVPYWNQGYCTEAAGALVDYLFQTFHVDCVRAHHFTRNPASGRVMEKIGMQPVGVQVHAFVKWGQPEDAKLYALTRADWEQRQSWRAR